MDERRRVELHLTTKTKKSFDCRAQNFAYDYFLPGVELCGYNSPAHGIWKLGSNYAERLDDDGVTVETVDLDVYLDGTLQTPQWVAKVLTDECDQTPWGNKAAQCFRFKNMLPYFAERPQFIEETPIQKKDDNPPPTIQLEAF